MEFRLKQYVKKKERSVPRRLRENLLVPEFDW
jgi:hypothetical protein